MRDSQKYVGYDVEQLQYQRYREDLERRHSGVGLMVTAVLVGMILAAVVSMVVH